MFRIETAAKQCKNLHRGLPDDGVFLLLREEHCICTSVIVYIDASGISL